MSRKDDEFHAVFMTHYRRLMQAWQLAEREERTPNRRLRAALICWWRHPLSRLRRSNGFIRPAGDCDACGERR
jgi:hypothetical protein